MNTLFEKFKECALTAKQAEKVRRGHDYCAILDRCIASAWLAVNENAGTGAYKTFDDYAEHIDRQTGLCNSHFGMPCLDQMMQDN